MYIYIHIDLNIYIYIYIYIFFQACMYLHVPLSDQQPGPNVRMGKFIFVQTSKCKSKGPYNGPHYHHFVSSQRTQCFSPHIHTDNIYLF